MKRIAWLVVVAALVGCSSSDYDDGGRQRGAYGGGYGRPEMQQRVGGAEGIAGMLPPGDWWHDPRLTASVNLTSDQIAALDKMSDRSVEIDRLERDSTIALRDLRTSIDADSAASGEIVNAAQRVRTLRNDVFDRQVELLAAERTLLSKQQWDALQTAMREERRDTRQQRRGQGGMGGRGGRGGRRPF